MNLNEWFKKGMSSDKYIQTMKVNKEEMVSISEGFEMTENEKLRSLELKNKGIRAIVLTEDWCGDAMINNAILMKLAKMSEVELSFLLRDQNLELMDQYLTNGTSRAIPIFVFIDVEGNEVGVWGPRAKEMQALIEKERASLPDKEAADFPDKQKELYGRLKQSYLTDKEIWHVVAESIMGSIQK